MQVSREYELRQLISKQKKREKFSRFMRRKGTYALSLQGYLGVLLTPYPLISKEIESIYTAYLETQIHFQVRRSLKDYNVHLIDKWCL